MSSIFVIVVVISFLFGVRKPIVGCIAGTIATAISYYLFIENFELLTFLKNNGVRSSFLTEFNEEEKQRGQVFILDRI